MSRLLGSVSCNIPGILWDKHQHTCFPSYNVLFMSGNHAISALVHCKWSLFPNTQHQSYLLQIAGWWETPETCCHMQQDSSSVYGTSWLLLIPFRHEANYIVLRTSHFFSLSSSSPIPNPQIMDTEQPQPGESRSNLPVGGCYIKFVTLFHTVRQYTPVTPQRPCQCSHQKYDPGCTSQNRP